MGPKKELLELETRRTIFRHIQDHPGVHLRQLERNLDIALSTLEYHLHQMERGGVLSTRSDGKVKGYFVSEGLDRRDKDLLYLIRQKMLRRVLALILMDPGVTPLELAEHLSVSPSTLSNHLKRLLKHEAVEVERVGRSKTLYVADEERVSRLLVTYRASLLDSIVDRFVATFEPIEAARKKAAAAGAEGPREGTRPAGDEPLEGTQAAGDAEAGPSSQERQAELRGPGGEEGRKGGSGARSDRGGGTRRDREGGTRRDTEARAVRGWVRGSLPLLGAWLQRALRPRPG